MRLACAAWATLTEGAELEDGTRVTVTGGRTLAAGWRRLWRWLRPLFGLGLLIFLLWQVDWQELGRIMSQASLGYIGMALLIELLNVIPKVLRWRALLLAQGTQEPFLRLFSIYLVGSFFNNFLPMFRTPIAVRAISYIDPTDGYPVIIPCIQLQAADYTTLFKRIAQIEMKIENKDLSKDIILALDSSGLKVTNRGDWIRKIWKVRRGWIKVHIGVDAKSKKLLAGNHR